MLRCCFFEKGVCFQLVMIHILGKCSTRLDISSITLACIEFPIFTLKVFWCLRDQEHWDLRDRVNKDPTLSIESLRQITHEVTIACALVLFFSVLFIFPFIAHCIPKQDMRIKYRNLSKIVEVRRCVNPIAILQTVFHEHLWFVFALCSPERSLFPVVHGIARANSRTSTVSKVCELVLAAASAVLYG